ncbi:hypothetical protein [Streptomyces sp. NBC_00690]|nr:hypothetical protein [Streptomyces sp. NBC_00690]
MERPKGDPQPLVGAVLLAVRRDHIVLQTEQDLVHRLGQLPQHTRR